MFAVRFPADLLERCRHQAKAEGCTTSDVIRRRLAESFAVDDAIALRQEVRRAS